MPKVKDTGWRKEVIALLKDKRVTVGIHNDPANAEKGFYNEFGTKTVPERSFLRSTFDKKERGYRIIIGQSLRKISLGTFSPEQALEYLGQKVVSDVKETMTTQTPSATDQNPLIDAGQLIDSIDFEVKIGL